MKRDIWRNCRVVKKDGKYVVQEVEQSAYASNIRFNDLVSYQTAQKATKKCQELNQETEDYWKSQEETLIYPPPVTLGSWLRKLINKGQRK